MSLHFIGQRFIVSRGGCWQCVLDCRSRLAEAPTFSQMAYNNEVEAYFSLLKRGIYGTFHHVSPQHLQRFVDEFDFRWSNRQMNDTQRTFIAIAQSGGKRLMYREAKGVDWQAK